MALAEICNFDSFMKPNSTTSSALFQDVIENQCSNIENNYQLAMPPFENVSFIFIESDRITVREIDFHFLNLAN